MKIAMLVCASILSNHPGCTEHSFKLLDEVTPQMCIIKGQEKLAQEGWTANDGHIIKWWCKR